MTDTPLARVLETENAGVSVDFFVASTKWLDRRYGKRTCGEAANEFIGHLGEAERLFQKFPKVAKMTSTRIRSKA